MEDSFVGNLYKNDPDFEGFVKAGIRKQERRTEERTILNN